MAAKNFRSTLLEPTSEFAHGDKLRFTALSTSGSVFNSSFSEAVIGDNGQYSVDLQYGKYRIDYKPYEGRWQKFADVEVSASTLATSLQSLALSSKPVTDDTILTLQSLLADAENSAESASADRAAAAASAAAAEKSAAAVDSVIDESSFFKRYVFPSSELHTDGSTGNYTLVKIDKYGESKYTTYEHPVISINATGSDVWSQAALLPMMSSIASYTGNTAIFGVSGNCDIRVFFGKDASSTEFALYIATRNTVYNNASVSLSVSTYKKLDSEIIGAVNIDSWLAVNSLVTETTKTGISTLNDNQHTLTSVDVAGKTWHNVPRSGAENYGLTVGEFDIAYAEQQNAKLFESEKAIALQIMSDYQLGLYSITEQDIADTKLYIQSIEPLAVASSQRSAMPRPLIFSRYKANPYEL